MPRLRAHSMCGIHSCGMILVASGVASSRVRSKLSMSIRIRSSHHATDSEAAPDQRFLVARDDDGGEAWAHPCSTVRQSARNSTRHAAPPMSPAKIT